MPKGEPSKEEESYLAAIKNTQRMLDSQYRIKNRYFIAHSGKVLSRHLLFKLRTLFEADFTANTYSRFRSLD